MFKRILLILALICMIVLPVFSQTGNYTSNEYFYLPLYGAYGMDEYNEYNLYMEKADNQIETNKGTFGSYYLKTEIDTLGEVETIYSKDITDSDELATALTDYYLKTAIDTLGEVETIYTKDITDSDELASALTLYYLKTAIDTQGEVETIWGVSLANDSELHTQNTDTDLDATFEATLAKSGANTDITALTGLTTPLGAAYGGTGKASWTQYLIPYTDTTTSFSQIAIGTDGQVLTSGGAGVAPSFEDAGGAGETNTASNIGSEIEIYKQKTGVDLEFRTLKADSNKITISTTPPSDVDIGAAATDRGTNYWNSYTVISKDNPSNLAGTITSVEIWADVNLSGCEVATFYVVSGNNLSTRDTEAIGTVTAGSKQTFPVNLDVEIGDYIGIYYPGGNIEADSSGGAGIWRNNSDQIPCTNFTFESVAGWVLSNYGTGASTEALDYIEFDVVETEMDVMNLLSTTTISFAADGDTTLYTVPTGKRCVLTHAIVVAAADAGATTTLSIGADGTETDFIPANTLSNLDAQYDSVILQPIPNTTPLKNKSYVAATVIQAQVATQSGAAGNTVYLFGILY